MEDLWIEQRKYEKEEQKEATANAHAHALSLALAKIQFVQVYLENPRMSFAATDPASVDDDDEQQQQHGDEAKLTTNKNEQKTVAQAGESNLQSETKIRAPAPDPQQDSSPTRPTRPSLAQSSFSWILGEEQRKSDFVAASPFSSDAKNARGRAAYLFGDDHSEAEASANRPVKPEENDKDQEVIKLGTWRD